ncbi:hypothetical protein [Microbacterium sp. USHLN186]|uniref:hypothetical protein n=1 Tax=Microbacterium sp. USHLN186 TaxID=3081286 RepID=UPI0030196A75
MSEADWSNDQLRTFFSALRSGGLFDRGASVDDEWRAAFRRQAMRRIVPAVERRLLAEVGAMLDAPGIAHVALEVAEDLAWGAEHAWLMVTAEPWRHLADLVRREIRRSYRKTVRIRRDAETLDGIEAASSRRALDAGEG